MTIKSFIFISFLLCLFNVNTSGAEPSSEIYARRVLPLLRSPAGSSCQECHFSGMELGDFLSDDEADTFAKLRAGGWIDLDEPGKSKLLTFVNRSSAHPSKEILAVRQKEQAALSAWITAAVSRPDLLSHKPKSDVGIELDAALVRHLRSDHVLSRFTDNIWSSMGRCINCHSPERNERQVKEHGDQMSWIVPHDPEATLAYLRENGLIDLVNPDDSEIRTKPTEIVEHGGGPKFSVGSAADKLFLAFLRDYAKVIDGSYTARSQLPTASTQKINATENFLRFVELPEKWGGKLLRVDLYTKTDAGWSTDPVASADGLVSEEKLQWQSSMWTISPLTKTPAKELLPGDYLARISVDQSDRLKNDPDASLSKDDFVGTIEFGGAWKPGWREPKIVDAGKIGRGN